MYTIGRVGALLLIAVVILAGCESSITEPACAVTAYESLPQLTTTENPDSSYVTRDTVYADPPCTVGDPWGYDEFLIQGWCICLDAPAR